MKDRRATLSLLSAALLSPLMGCNAQETPKGFPMKERVVLHLVTYNYLDRPIHDVFLNKVDIGGGNAFGGSGIITGVTIPLGPQTLTWELGGPRGMARNGETVAVKNALILTADQIPPDARYIGVHIYPDDTAEFTFSEHFPDTTPRGDELIAKGRARHGG